uniref:hypothetical protein n=1 Tax=Clostridium sp. NkU-1 TaxID=1095009 RepID=UPI0006D21C41
MFEKWTDQGKRENLHILLWIGLITVLLLLLSVAGSIRNGEEPSRDITEAEKAEPRAMAVPLNETLSDEIILSPGDKEFLTQLTWLFDQGDLEGAARLLNSYDIPWKEFPCMYDGAAMRGKISSGKGLVFVKASTVFMEILNTGNRRGNVRPCRFLNWRRGNATITPMEHGRAER